MRVIESCASLQNIVNQLINENKSIGFIPTMGALHRGHCSLVDRSVSENATTIASIFVNPTQFNDPKDLQAYPRTLVADLKLLESHGCNYAFCPTDKEMYPEGMKLINMDLGNMGNVMEGRFRPGHFNGMVTIVSKLLSLVNPQQAYFGEKDFQQLAIIRYMVRKLEFPVQIHGCETIREQDGLALSSRNIRLTKEERKAAPVIFKSLNNLISLKDTLSVHQVIIHVINEIQQTGLFEVEYLQVVNALTLEEVDHWKEANNLRACIAVKASHTRLIDNIPV